MDYIGLLAGAQQDGEPMMPKPRHDVSKRLRVSHVLAY